VMIEALACGTPVAALPAPGPVDVLDAEVGAIDGDLETAIAAALTRSRRACVDYAAQFTWDASARQFLDSLAPIRVPEACAA
jgi:glycosyltransferase involved in cell wall biosynthesis